MKKYKEIIPILGVFVLCLMFLVAGSCAKEGINTNVSDSADENENINTVVNENINIVVNNINESTNTNTNSDISDAVDTTNTDVETSNINTEEDPYAGWGTYTNETYDYTLRYPEHPLTDITIITTTTNPSTGEELEDICVQLIYGGQGLDYGYIKISAPDNYEYSQVICGRTGYGYQTTHITEDIDINGITYTAEGEEEQGPGATTNYHNETLVFYLADNTRIEYGAMPGEVLAWESYLGAKNVLLQILESYQAI